MFYYFDIVEEKDLVLLMTKFNVNELNAIGEANTSIVYSYL